MIYSNADIKFENRYSSIFKAQIEIHKKGLGEAFYNEKFQYYEKVLYNTDVIFDKISLLEKKAFNKNLYKPFKYINIKGLYHVHHFQPLNMAKNCKKIFNAKAKNYSMNVEQYEECIFSVLYLYNRMIKNLSENEAYEKALGYLTRNRIDDCYIEACDKKILTGDWLVLLRKDDVNYYLTLARHEEPQDMIFKRVFIAIEELIFGRKHGFDIKNVEAVKKPLETELWD